MSDGRVPTSGYTVGDPPPSCTCGPYWSIVPPGPCPHHSEALAALPLKFAPTPRLADEDVERIAQRVADLLRLPILPPRAPHISPALLDLAAEDDDEDTT